jgi:DNA-binding NarL/FixJ family response regulator
MGGWLRQEPTLARSRARWSDVAACREEAVITPIADIEAPAVATRGRSELSGVILAIDARPLVRAGLARLAAGALGCRVEAVADLTEATHALRRNGYPPRALLLGIPRGQDPRILVTKAMRHTAPVICAIDSHDEDELASHALTAGAHGYLVIEHASTTTLRATLLAIEHGHPTATPTTDPRKRPAPITQRSLEVLSSLADGLHDHEISTRLGISTSSVRKHIASAQTRLHARTRTQAVATATRTGLL